MLQRRDVHEAALFDRFGPSRRWLNDIFRRPPHPCIRFELSSFEDRRVFHALNWVGDVLRGHQFGVRKLYRAKPDQTMSLQCAVPREGTKYGCVR